MEEDVLRFRYLWYQWKQMQLSKTIVRYPQKLAEIFANIIASIFTEIVIQNNVKIFTEIDTENWYQFASGHFTEYADKFGCSIVAAGQWNLYPKL